MNANIVFFMVIFKYSLSHFKRDKSIFKKLWLRYRYRNWTLECQLFLSYVCIKAIDQVDSEDRLPPSTHHICFVTSKKFQCSYSPGQWFRKEKSFWRLKFKIKNTLIKHDISVPLIFRSNFCHRTAWLVHSVITDDSTLPTSQIPKAYCFNSVQYLDLSLGSQNKAHKILTRDEE